MHRWMLMAAALVALAGPAAAQETPAPPEKKALLALGDRWFAAADDDARRAVEREARALGPLDADLVEAFSEHLFDLARKSGPRLPRKGRAYFYDEKTKDGLILQAPGRRKGGLLIALHGGGEGQGDAGSAHSVWVTAKGLGWTVISPEVRRKVSSAWNTEEEERFVLDLIDAARRTYDIDPDKVYIAGHSMGGDGSWMIGGRNADRFASAAPLAGSIMPFMRQGTLNRIDTPRSDYMDLMEGVLPNLMHLPYWIAHSDDDVNEAIHPDDIATERLKKLQERFPDRYPFVYDRITGNGHALPPKGVKPILQWMASHVREPHPREVMWETWWPWKRRMYWVWCENPGRAWRFHARIVGPNHVDVDATAKPIGGQGLPQTMPFSLLLAPALFDLDQPLRVTSGGKTVFDGVVPRSAWSVLVSVARRNDPEQWYEAHVDLELPRRAPWTPAWEAVPPAKTGEDE